MKILVWILFRCTINVPEVGVQTRRIYVISDLHLGGSPDLQTSDGKTISFQMCPPKARRRLARFIERIASTSNEAEETQLIINGDFVDFLAEESEDPDAPWEPFTRDPSLALRKLQRIIRRVDEGVGDDRVFASLKKFVAKGHILTLLLGNHDLELSLPGVRRALMDYLTDGKPARVEFLFDGEAYPLGDLLIEHGNRYDGWNSILYGELRARRSTASREEEPLFDFNPPYGSKLVSQIMNPLKQEFPFVDLIKPETEAVITILSAFKPPLLTNLSTFLNIEVLQRRARSAELRPGAVEDRQSRVGSGRMSSENSTRSVENRETVWGNEPGVEVFDRTVRALQKAKSEWGDTGVSDADSRVTSRGLNQILATGTIVTMLHDARKLQGRALTRLVAKVRGVLIRYNQEISDAFNPGKELPQYLEAARRLAGTNKVVLFGHTHLPKAIRMKSGGLYLNSGTWCPTVAMNKDWIDPKVPDADVLTPLTKFLLELPEKTAEQWPLTTTFVEISQSAGKSAATLREICEDGSEATIAPQYES